MIKCDRTPAELFSELPAADTPRVRLSKAFRSPESYPGLMGDLAADLRENTDRIGSIPNEGVVECTNRIHRSLSETLAAYADPAVRMPLGVLPSTETEEFEVARVTCEPEHPHAEEDAVPDEDTVSIKVNTAKIQLPPDTDPIPLAGETGHRYDTSSRAKAWKRRARFRTDATIHSVILIILFVLFRCSFIWTPVMNLIHRDSFLAGLLIGLGILAVYLVLMLLSFPRDPKRVGRLKLTAIFGALICLATAYSLKCGMPSVFTEIRLLFAPLDPELSGFRKVLSIVSRLAVLRTDDGLIPSTLPVCTIWLVISLLLQRSACIRRAFGSKARRPVRARKYQTEEYKAICAALPAAHKAALLRAYWTGSWTGRDKFAETVNEELLELHDLMIPAVREKFRDEIHC